MASQIVEIRVTTKRRVRQTGGNSGYEPCKVCHGTGRVKVKTK